MPQQGSGQHLRKKLHLIHLLTTTLLSFLKY